MCKHSRVHGKFAVDLFKQNSVVHRAPRMCPPSVVSETEENVLLVGEFLRQPTVAGLSLYLSLMAIASSCDRCFLTLQTGAACLDCMRCSTDVASAWAGDEREAFPYDGVKPAARQHFRSPPLVALNT